MAKPIDRATVYQDQSTIDNKLMTLVFQGVLQQFSGNGPAISTLAEQAGVSRPTFYRYLYLATAATRTVLTIAKTVGGPTRSHDFTRMVSRSAQEAWEKREEIAGESIDG